MTTEEIEIIPVECYINKKSPLYSKIQNFLFGLAPAGSDPLRQRSIYAGFDKDIRIFQTWDEDESFLVKSMDTQTFLNPVEISVYLRECNNKAIVTAEKSTGLKSLNFVSDLNCDPRLINEKGFKLSREKEVEAANLGLQRASKLAAGMSLEEQILYLTQVEEEVKYMRSLLSNKKIKIISEIRQKQLEEHAKERLNIAEGIKTTKSGKIIKVANGVSKKQQRRELVIKYGERKVKYFEAVKTLDINNPEHHKRYDEFIKNFESQK